MKTFATQLKLAAHYHAQVLVARNKNYAGRAPPLATRVFLSVNITYGISCSENLIKTLVAVI